MPNLFADIPRDLPDELFETLAGAGPVRIERIVSNGQTSPEGFWYDQTESEWVVVLQGSARLRFEDENADTELGVGDHVLIAPHRRHRVTYTAAATVWLAVFF
ncbi:cupin domain-containing protein [Jeongeupia naejangsanensis]|uniref:Cupin domain-containing protein n=1 Tax=Jeongeupia naejangsanensis TaxID=613195 RepID=A0ABS2BJR2_9NEIS|nr:cupin domain-containing protein [Jeongeupia naejangsanensis]MBM3115848.1 cupin domain-containing protein [Jeongeupia naejangsanensis]